MRQKQPILQSTKRTVSARENFSASCGRAGCLKCANLREQWRGTEFASRITLLPVH